MQYEIKFCGFVRGQLWKSASKGSFRDSNKSLCYAVSNSGGSSGGYLLRFSKIVPRIRAQSDHKSNHALKFPEGLNLSEANKISSCFCTTLTNLEARFTPTLRSDEGPDR